MRGWDEFGILSFHLLICSLGGKGYSYTLGGYNFTLSFTFKNSEQNLCSSPFSWHSGPVILDVSKFLILICMLNFKLFQYPGMQLV